jgi:hypothetical protein
MFERWIKLFGETCDELFEGPVAERLAQRQRALPRALNL